MTAQAIVKRFRGRREAIKIRTKKREHLSANKPLSECIIDNVNKQCFINRILALFHNDKVIGLQHKYTTKKNKTEVQNQSKTVQYRL